MPRLATSSAWKLVFDIALSWALVRLAACEALKSEICEGAIALSWPAVSAPTWALLNAAICALDRPATCEVESAAVWLVVRAPIWLVERLPTAMAVRLEFESAPTCALESAAIWSLDSAAAADFVRPDIELAGIAPIWSSDIVWICAAVRPPTSLEVKAANSEDGIAWILVADSDEICEAVKLEKVVEARPASALAASALIWTLEIACSADVLSSPSSVDVRPPAWSVVMASMSEAFKDAIVAAERPLICAWDMPTSIDVINPTPAEAASKRPRRSTGCACGAMRNRGMRRSGNWETSPERNH